MLKMLSESRQIYRWRGGRGREKGWRVGRMEGWKRGRLEEWKNGRLEEERVGRMEGWKNGRSFRSLNTWIKN